MSSVHSIQFHSIQIVLVDVFQECTMQVHINGIQPVRCMQWIMWFVLINNKQDWIIDFI